MPVPLGGPPFTPNVGRGSDAFPDAATRENHYSQPTALNRQRTTSNTTVPGIDVVTPVSLNLFPLALRYIFTLMVDRLYPFKPISTNYRRSCSSYARECEQNPTSRILRTRTSRKSRSGAYVLAGFNFTSTCRWDPFQ